MTKKPYILAATSLILISALPSDATTQRRILPSAQTADYDITAYEMIEGLTTEVGQRQAGTEAEGRARTWALKKLKSMGFDNVREENFMMPTWVRGAEKAEVISPYPQKLEITALGNSASTGDKPLEGDILYVPTFDDLTRMNSAEFRGKIIFVDHQMRPAQDGSSYGYFGKARFMGPNIAAKNGAAAIIVRSIGTDSHRLPHTGNTNFDEGITAIPAGAISNPDADNLVHILKKDRAIRLSLTLTPRNLGQQKSGNIIAEVTGKNPALPPIIIACHLDSWDLGTGAIDDAAGCGIITAAASKFIGNTRPKRTIRILWAGAEEVGIWGGKDYTAKHRDTPHALAMESDFGADRIWRVDFKLPESAKSLSEQIAIRLAPLGISTGKGDTGAGADVEGIIKAQNLGIINLQQDGTRYFDLHHTADDTLDKIDKDQLRQNVQAWTTVLELVANYEGELTLGTKP